MKWEKAFMKKEKMPNFYLFVVVVVNNLHEISKILFALTMSYNQ